MIDTRGKQESSGRVAAAHNPSQAEDAAPGSRGRPSRRTGQRAGMRQTGAVTAAMLAVCLVMAATAQAQQVAGTINAPPGTEWSRVVLDPGGGKLFVADKTNKMILVFSASTLAAAGVISPAGYVPASNAPQEIALHQATRTLYVAMDNGGATSATTILAFDADTFAFKKSFSGIGLSLKLCVDEARGRLYTFGSGPGLRKTLTGIDVATNTVTGSFNVESLVSPIVKFSGPRALNPVTGELVFNSLHADQIAVVNGMTMAGQGFSVPFSRGWDATWNPAENKIYITTASWGGYLIFDRDAGTSMLTSCVNDGTSLFYSQATNRIYSGAEINRDTTVIEGPNDTCQNVEVGMGLADVAFIPANRRAYFARGSAVVVLDEDRLSVVASLPNCSGAGYGVGDTWIEADATARRVFAVSTWSMPTRGSCLTAIDDLRCPTVTGISPSSGPVGSQVVITGTNLLAVSSVRFGGGVAAPFAIDSETQITATVPDGAVNGPISLGKDGCQDVLTSTFAVLTCQVACAAIVPAVGQAAAPTLFDGSATAVSSCLTGPVYDWDFGDGSPHSSAPSPSHTYAAPGSYHWVLTVTADGKTSTCEGNIEVGEACMLSCSASVPSYTKVNATTPLQASATASNCQGPVTFEWDFGDGSAPSSEQNPNHAFAAVGVFPWQLVVRANGLSCTQNGSITVGAGYCTGPWVRFVPAAANNEGLNKTRWLSDLDLMNPDEEAARVDLALLLKDHDNSNPQVAGVEVPAGRALRLYNVLGSIFQAANAAIGVRFCDDDVLVNSRFYNTGAGGGVVYGMYIDSVGEESAVTPNEIGYFHHLSYSTDAKTGSRVNIGFVNAVGFVVDLVVRLYGDDGGFIGFRNVRLQPYDHRQYTRIHELVGSPTVTSGYATVEVLTPNARVHPYAMLIENISGDPIYMPVKVVTPPPAQ